MEREQKTQEFIRRMQAQRVAEEKEEQKAQERWDQIEREQKQQDAQRKLIGWIAAVSAGALLLWVMGAGQKEAHFEKGDTSYINRNGDHIAIPGQSSNGATARCRDGSWSYSQHRQGTCSQEGGVQQWLR
jgi:uncharacterized protein DUF3761